MIVYGLALVIAAVCGARVLAGSLVQRGVAPASFVVDVLPISLLSGILGARLAGLLDVGVPAELTWAWALDFSATSSWGGLLTGVVTACALAWRRGVSVLRFLDALPPALLVAYAIGRLGCHVTGDGCYGLPSDLPWACAYPDGLVPTQRRVHPTPLYECVYALLILALLPGLSRRLVWPGQLFGAYLLLHGTARFLVECLRRNPRHGPLSSAQWFCLGMLALGAVLLLRRARRAPR